MDWVKSNPEKEWYKKDRNKFFSMLICILMVIIHFTLLTIPVYADPGAFSLKWTINYGYQSYSVPVAEDINGDGIYEIFVGGRNPTGADSAVFCINSLNGGIIWKKTFRTLIGYHVPIAIGDLDNDGTYEIVHAAGSRTIARNAEDGSVFWNVSTDSAWGVPAIVDLDGTGIPYVIVGDNSGFDPPVLLSKLYGNNGIVAATAPITYTCYGGVSVADLNHDGSYEIVISDAGDSYCFDEDLNLLWTTAPYTSESHCAVLVDVTGDDKLEVVMMQQAGSGVKQAGIHVYYANGTLVPGKSSPNLGLTAHCQPAVYDIDKDGNVELITAYDSDAYVWDLGRWALDTTLERGAEPPDIANVLGDDNLEIVSPFAFYDDNVDIYDKNYNNVDEINNIYGLNTLVLDFDNDGLNELLIHRGDGVMSLIDTLAETFSPSQRGDTPYYSERRANAGVYVPKIGPKCTLSNPSPFDNTTGVSTSISELKININEPNSDPIDWWIQTSPDIGGASGAGEQNGTKTCPVSGLQPATTYTWTITATDGTNWKIKSYQFTTADLGGDTTPPQISAMSIITSNPLDTDPLYGWINVSCTVTDNVAVSQVILRIHNPSGSWNNVSMTTRTPGKYYYRTTSAFSSEGNYSYTILAKDSSNNVKASSTEKFSMSPNWDISNDGGSNVLDLVLVSNRYGITGSLGWIREDVDNNGVINVLDINLVSNHFGEQWST